MLFKSLAYAAATAGLLKTAVAEDLPAIEIVGNKFFYSNNGSQFYIRGIAYQQDTANISSDETFVDPLADEAACERDIPYLQELNTNTIRVYALNESKDHTACMQLLQEAGIYVIADLSEPSLSIDRDDPSWTVELYNRYTSVVDAFHNYTNILGFFAGNEVSNDNTNTAASAFVKAAIRDTKAYIEDQGYRSIPVGYSSNDDSDTRVAMADYFTCGDDDVRADFYGINMYEWCGDSTFAKSGYEDRTEEFANLTVPVFFSEYGCNEVTPRKFTEVAALYSDEMTDVWSGGIVYMYFEEDNNYGLVSIDGDDVSTLEDFSYYSEEIWAITPTSADSDDVTSTDATLACPTQYSNWKASTDLPPTPDDTLCSCMENSVSCIVSDDVDEDDYADLFSIVCGYVDCSGITANGTTGEYGAYSFCSSKQQLDFVLDLYYQSVGSDDACDFDGSATLGGAGSTASSCTSLLSAAGTDGTGDVTDTGDDSTDTEDSTASDDASDSSTGTASSSTSTSTGSSAGSTVRVPGGEKFMAVVFSLVAITGISVILL